MASPLHSFLILTRKGDAAAAELGRESAAWLTGRGARAEVCEHDSGGTPAQRRAEEQGGFDAVLVLGGDGTFIGVARRTLGLGVPILGLNLGRVGFLAEAVEGWRERLAALVDGAYTVSRRICLAYAVLRQGERILEGRAVNDLVVSRGDLARLIRLSVERGPERVGAMRADGLIVSTPTGSTAYGFSAGGPLVHPEMEAFCLTPVCPFLNNFRPLVLPAGEDIRVRVDEPRGEVRLSVDGQRCVPLAPGDLVVIRRADHDLLVAETEGPNYFAKLAAKGFLTER